MLCDHINQLIILHQATFNVQSKITRTAWAVFKYCGTKNVPLRMKKKYEKIDLKFISKETNKIRGKK